MKILLIILVILFATLLFKYSTIQLYNTIYFDKNNNKVVVIEKSLFYVTIAYMDDIPRTISIFDFMINYSKNII